MTSPSASVPIAPALCTSAPSLASVTAAPAAVPAGVMRISSTSCPPWPSGIASTGRASTSTTCTPIAIAVMSPAIVDLLGGSVAALERGRHDRLALVVGQRSRRSDRGGAPVDVAGPLQQQRVLDGGIDVVRPGDRAVVGHQRRESP